MEAPSTIQDPEFPHLIASPFELSPVTVKDAALGRHPKA
jgi:hypothetical protein